jgi:hypothetical protein
MLSSRLSLLNTGLRVLELMNGSLDLNILNWLDRGPHTR